MTYFPRTLRQAFVACVLFVSLASAVRAQVIVPGPWPGGWGACGLLPFNDAFQLFYNPALAPPCNIGDAALRLTIGGTPSATLFGQLGVVDTNHDFFTPSTAWFSAIAHLNATVLRSSEGDLVLSATFPSRGASIRFGTTPPDSLPPSAEQPNDLERMTLWWDGKAAIGTQGTLASAIFGDSLRPGEYDLLHLHVPCLPMTYTVDPARGYTSNQLMTLKLSYGGITDPYIRFAQLGFDRNQQLASFSSNEDLVLSTNRDTNFGPDGSGHGDIIVSNRRIGKAIRFATTPDTAYPSPGLDKERFSILSNGNVGIDVPPNSTTGLSLPMDQVQIGGGTMIDTTYGAPIPGLTIYGGSPFEGMFRPGGGTYPLDWRGIAFNHWEDHRTGYAARFAPMPWDQLAFSDQDGGLISLATFPWHTGDSLTGNDSGVFLQVTGQQGLSMFCYEGASDPYHHLFDVWRPGFTPWPVTRNVNGLFFHNTPVYIGTGTVDFTNFHNVHPDIGDDSTWELAVNGAALAKEFFVLDTVWSDYFFMPSYKLMPILDLEHFLDMNHHLPDVPSASEIAKSGVPIGRVEAGLTKNVEELTLRTIQLSKENEELVKQNDKLAMALEQLQREVSELKEKAR